MKIARIEMADGEASWALLSADERNLQRIRAPFAVWATEAAVGRTDAFDLDVQPLALEAVRLLPPVEPTARVFGVGLNYLSHLTRLGRKEAPPHTIGYIKPLSALVEAGGEIAYPAVTRQLDYEIELVAVVAKPLGNAVEATECLLGYTIGNDVSARDAGKALGSLDLFTQKALDRTAPLGPWITTLDACGGAGQPALDVALRINGEERQRDNSRNMIFTLNELLDFIDARVSLQPGDVLFTGSTCGVGLEDGRFLQPGDAIEAEIAGIGVLRNVIGSKLVLPVNRSRGRLGIV